MKRMLTTLVTAVVMAAWFCAPSPAKAAWPDKAIKMTICYGAGGTTDMSIRMLSSILEQGLGAPVVAENKPGGGGSVAASLVSNKKPDGYNYFTLVTAAGAINPHSQSLPYDPLKDLTLIARVGQWHYGLAVRTDAPYQSFEEFLQYAKDHPGGVSYGISGVGTSQHLVMEWFRAKAGVDWKAVPFKNGTEAVSACMGGHVTAMAGVTEWLPQVRSGEMRLLALFDEERVAEFPEVPTVRELGYDIVAPSYLAIAGPAGIPAEIVAKMDQAIAKAMQEPRFVELMKKIMVKSAYMDHEQFDREFRRIYQEVGEIMQGAGLARQ